MELIILQYMKAFSKLFIYLGVIGNYKSHHMKKFCLIYFLLIISYGYSQANLYWFKNDIENTFVKDTVKDKSWRSQMGATYFSISNNYKNALESWDISFGREKNITEKDRKIFSNYNSVNAKKFIINRSKKEQMIIINEAHHNSSHRNFVKSLLKGLYKNGYRYLGVETLKNDDSLNIRKFANQESGFYSKEPQFGLFLKEALSIGFKVFPYESKGNGKEREIGQAKNISDFMTKNNNGKMLIYCGYEHAYEGKHQTWEKTMAERVKDLTGINPFTIDQTKFSERSQEKFTEPLVKMINKKYPSILVDKHGNIFNGENRDFYTDAVIIGATTHYENGKPNWMLEKGKIYYAIPQIPKQKSVLVLAYKEGEYKRQGIPEDITEVESWDGNNYLILGKGNYDLIYLNEEYKTVKSEKIKIK